MGSIYGELAAHDRDRPRTGPPAAVSRPESRIRRSGAVTSIEYHVTLVGNWRKEVSRRWVCIDSPVG